MIEKTLERIADALEAIAGNTNTKPAAAPLAMPSLTPTPAPKQAVKKEKPVASETRKKEVTIAEVTTALRGFVDAKNKAGLSGHEEGKALLAKFGAERISELNQADYAAFIDCATGK